jgi:hypothetical protein
MGTQHGRYHTTFWPENAKGRETSTKMGDNIKMYLELDLRISEGFVWLRT